MYLLFKMLMDGGDVLRRAAASDPRSAKELAMELTADLVRGVYSWGYHAGVRHERAPVFFVAEDPLQDDA
jgi:hypothetical protein